MANYLMKYKGTYRLLPELDCEYHDFPREKTGEIIEGYEDIYIACQNGNRIYTYGHINNSKAVYLWAYIPSIGRGRNIIREIKANGIEYLDYIENDEEVEFKFKAKDIELIAQLMKAKTSGAGISPFSSKNLPKRKDVEIPLEEIERYKEAIALVKKEDLLLIHKLTNEFLENVLQKNYKKMNRKFSYKKDIKKEMLSRQVKEYIYIKKHWDKYLDYLKKEIKNHYNN